MTERIRVSSTYNPEYSLIKGYVEEAFLEERGGRPLSRWHRRSAGFVARYIAIFSTLKPSEQTDEIVKLDRLVLRSRGSRGYSIWVGKKANELLPGWMGLREIVKRDS